jgi:hypothetical protein
LERKESSKPVETLAVDRARVHSTAAANEAVGQHNAGPWQAAEQQEERNGNQEIEESDQAPEEGEEARGDQAA